MKEKPDAPVDAVPEPKPKRPSKFPFVAVLLLFLILIGGGIALIKFPTVSRLLRRALPVSLNNPVIIRRPPKLLMDQAVTTEVKKDFGGMATVTSPKGYTYRVSVGPNVLPSDGTVRLTPLEEPPFTWPSDPNGSNPPPDPGIDITIDPPPPTPSEDEPVDPDDPPDTGSAPPILVVIIPPGRTGTVIPVETETTQTPTDLLAGMGLGNLITNLPISVSPTPQSERNTAGSGTAMASIPASYVYIPTAGNPRIIQTSPAWAGGSNTDGGDEGNGTIPGEGTVTPDDPGNDEGKANDAANQAAANGRCTDEYVFAYTQAYQAAQAAGNTREAGRYGSALRECSEERLSYLKRLCETDPTLVRRKDFADFRTGLGNSTDQDTLRVLAQLMELEQSCQASYRIQGAGEPWQTAGSYARITSTVDSTVDCGYIDDMWKGTDTYTFDTADGARLHTYEGKHEFKLPPRGGIFGATDTSGGHGGLVTTSPVPINLQPIKFGVWGMFDGVKTLDVMLYPGVHLPITIQLSQRTCAGTGSVPPLEPLTR